MEKAIRVLVANRPRMMRGLILATDADRFDIEIIGEVANDEGIPKTVERNKPNLVAVALAGHLYWARVNRRRGDTSITERPQYAPLEHSVRRPDHPSHRFPRNRCQEHRLIGLAKARRARRVFAGHFVLWYGVYGCVSRVLR